jgi:rhodanese-related sulfurtransferase
MTQTITPTQAHEWLKKGEAVLIDVRDPDEFSAEHIPYAVSMPISQLKESLQLLQIPTSRKIIFQCLRGTRGERACQLAQNQENYANTVYNMAGGMTEWKTAGLPVISKDTAHPKLSIFRQVQIIVGALVSLFVLLGFAGMTAAFALAGFLGAALCVAGMTGWCGLAVILLKMPWNR